VSGVGSSRSALDADSTIGLLLMRHSDQPGDETLQQTDRAIEAEGLSTIPFRQP